MSTVSRTPSVVNKRKSVLSELGIKPGAETPTTKSSTLSRKVSKSVSPSASKAATATTTTRRSVVPSTIKVDRSSSNNNALKSPTSPNPKPRSVTPNQKSSISPLGRRASVNSGNPASVAHKRMSTPSGLNSLLEVDSMKEQLVDKDNEIQRLKEIETESEHKISALEIEVDKLKAELKLSLETNNSGIDNDEKELIIKEVEEKCRSEAEALLKEQEMKYNAERDALLKEHENRLEQEKDSLLKEQETQIESLKVSTSSNTEEKLTDLRSEYDNQISKLKQDHELSLKGQKEEFSKQLFEREAQFEKQIEEHNLIISDLKEQLQALEESQSIGHLRKVQNELETTLATFEEYKRSSQHEIEVLEKRYREEIKQLQNGNDDTAEAWLEKTRSAQQEVNQLHDEMQLKDQEYEQAIQLLKDIHAEEEEKLHEICDEKEAQIEAQSHQIENLLYQVETLQNTLEAATVRLEHTAKSTPTTSSTKDDINSAGSLSPVRNIHQECLLKVEAKHKEIDDLRSNISELKETHEMQMNRLAQEKASKIQELKKKVVSLEQELATATPPLSPTKSTTDSLKASHDQQLVQIAEKHRNEVSKIHEQYQIQVDEKSRELEDYVYRVKALMASKQKDIEKMRMEANTTVDKYEQDIKGYEATLIEYEKQVSQLKEGCAAHMDENSQLVRLVHQLQSEIHR